MNPRVEHTTNVMLSDKHRRELDSLFVDERWERLDNGVGVGREEEGEGVASGAGRVVDLSHVDELVLSVVESEGRL